MAEQINAAPDVEYNDDGTKNPDYVAPKSGSESAVIDTKNKDDKTETEKEDEFDDTIDPNKLPEIPVRKFNAQHIIARKNEKIKKLENKIGKNEDDSDEDDNPQDDDIEESVEQVIDKKLRPVLDVLISKADEDELKALVKDEPEAAKYENHIKAYMSHDSYKGVSPLVIYHHLAFKNAQALGAKKKQVADLEANQTKGGGRTLRPNEKVGDFPSAQDIADMSEEDFEKMQNKALQQ